MLYNIIGDIHGREIWKTLIKKDAVNIFVGDYLDPYIDISFEQCLQNFQDIITLKQLNPQSIILLLGNHDLHYFDVGEHCSRYDYDNALTIRNFLCDNIHWFHGIAYSIDNFEKLPIYLNVGLGHDYTVDEYYEAIARVVGYTGQFTYNTDKPEGMKRKLTDVTNLNAFGWQSKISLIEGLQKTFAFYLQTER